LAFSVLIVTTIALVGRNDFGIGVDASRFRRAIASTPPMAAAFVVIFEGHFALSASSPLFRALVDQLFQSSCSGMLVVAAIALTQPHI
jgi:hypothetical protein